MRTKTDFSLRWTLLGSILPTMLLGSGCKDEDEVAREPTTQEPVVGKAVMEDRKDVGTRAQPGMQEGPGAQEQAAQAQADAYPRLDDEKIAKAVERELREDKAVPDDLEVQSRYGIVTLTGTVGDLLAQQRAIRLAETIRGVKVIVDDLQVQTKEVDDQTLRKDVQQALLDDPAADRWQMDVKVDQGRVTLSGTLESWTERNYAQRVVMGVRGVKAVDDEITVEQVAERPDPEVQRDVQARLRWDALVDHELIAVAVDDGVVSLTGTVGSAAQRRRARADAWVAGAKDVDITNLQVEAWAHDQMQRDPAAPAPTDAEIADAVKLALAYEPLVLSYQIDPQVSGGVVTLTGTVPSAKARDAAERTASTTVGVTKVENRIDVKAKAPMDDQALASRIDQALLRNPTTESYEIDVTVDDGRATLTGSVDDYAEYSEAADVASGIAGVMTVENQLTVADPAPFLYDPYLLPYHPYGAPGVWHGPYTTSESDEEIAEEIRDELFWSPFVDRNEIQVSVQSGKAVLSGTVDSWMEYRSATENAYEGGALSVDNQLKVSG